MDINYLALLPFGLGFLTLISLFLRAHFYVPVATAVASVASAVLLGFLGPFGLFSLAFYVSCLALTLSFDRFPRLSYAALFSLLLTSVFLAAHLVPDIHRHLVVDSVVVSPGAAPFTLYWNYDKLLVAMALLAVVVYRIPARCVSFSSGKLALAPILLTPVFVLGAGVLLGVIEWDPKVPQFLVLWSVSNLLITCVAEEAFFRGIILAELSEKWRSTRYGTALALGVSSLIFGLVHFSGGYVFILLSTLAGIGYGAAFVLTRRVEVSVFAHFLLNLCHLLLFTYPALSSASAN